MMFNFEATGVGSVPLKSAKEALDIIFDNFKSIPFWPQLPKRIFLENMYAQYSEKIPGIVLDENKRSVHIDSSRVAYEIEEIYEKYMAGDVDFFKISENYAQGFYEFLKRLEGQPGNIKYAKGQTIGPVSYALTLTDQNKRSVIYDKDLFDVLTKVLAMKARWQIRKLKKLAPGVIIFLDEPSLVSIGSSYININISDAFEKLGEIIKAVKLEGALCGIHCCGNTDWEALLKTDIDILSFDAYNFMKEFLLFGPGIKNFLQKGGTIAWGVVPTSPSVKKETKSSLVEKLKTAEKILAQKGVKKEDISSLITPSCGTGTLDEEMARFILKTTGAVSAALQK